MKTLLIQGAYLIDPASSLEGERDILIREGKFARIAPAIEAPEDAEVIDAHGLVAAPGLIDTHSHFRDPGFTYKEDLLTGAAAAVHGGYTSIVLMANTRPPVDNIDTLTDILTRGKESAVHLYSCSNVTRGMRGKELAPLIELRGAGAAGFTDDGVPIMDPDILRHALIIARELDVPVSLHEEDKSLIREPGVNGGGRAAAALGLLGAPREAEISMIRRDVQIAIEEDAPLCIQHISTAEGVELIRQARKKNPKIHAEATPHHFSLTEDAVIRQGTLAKVNPPVRLESDRQAIIRGLMDGTLDLIATDHAPHATREKEQPFTKAPSGMIGLETALSLGIKNLVEPGYLTLRQMLACLTINPARFYHLPAGKVQEEAPADLVLFDPKETWTVTRESFHSRSCNSPFIGQTLPGVVHLTLVGGEKRYEL